MIRVGTTILVIRVGTYKAGTFCCSSRSCCLDEDVAHVRVVAYRRLVIVHDSVDVVMTHSNPTHSHIYYVTNQCERMTRQASETPHLHRRCWPETLSRPGNVARNPLKPGGYLGSSMEALNHPKTTIKRDPGGWDMELWPKLVSHVNPVEVAWQQLAPPEMGASLCPRPCQRLFSDRKFSNSGGEMLRDPPRTCPTHWGSKGTICHGPYRNGALTITKPL